jgi:DNA-binding transcriptional ArsR family regulator
MVRRQPPAQPSHQPSQLHGALSALAAPRRFDLLLLMLAGHDRSVSQLAEAVGLSQSCTTRHLQALARAGLVKGVRDGKRVVFRIAPRDAAARVVLASVSGRPAPARVVKPRDAAARARPRRTARVAAAPAQIPQHILGAMVHIESAAELEPIVVEDRGPRSRDESGEQVAVESGRTSEPEAAPAWQRSELEDFLL